MNRSLVFLLLITAVLGCSNQSESNSNSEAESIYENASVRVVLASDVKWEPLNPARGNMSPRAGTLWGDRNAEVPTGFLVKFVDGFSSPPHIHNVTYRAVVIDGTIHNDDPNAEYMWMNPGSFWTQPMGEVHITAAKGTTNIALVEIDKGPYLVKAVSQAFDSGERPVNLDTSNIVWLPVSEQSIDEINPYISYLWGQYEEAKWSGSFLKLPPGFVGKLKASGTMLHAVVIQGSLMYGNREPKKLHPGSYVGAQGSSEHQLRTTLEKESIVYIRTNGLYKITQDG